MCVHGLPIRHRFTTPDCRIRRPKNFEPPLIEFYDELPPVVLIRDGQIVADASAMEKRYPGVNAYAELEEFRE